MKVRRILCPTDFSEFSDRALEHAAAHARWNAADLTLLHVNPFVVPIGGGAPYVPAYMPADAPTRARLQEGLEAAAQLARAMGLDPQLVLEDGDPSDVILRHAHATDTNLIVMGTHGLRGFDRWLLGSVAARVAQRSHCAVLTVPGRPESAGPRSGPLYRTILCAVELLDSEPIVDFAFAVGRAAGAPVTLLHVLEELPAHEAAALLARIDWPTFRGSLENDARERLARAVARCPAEGLPIEQVVARGRPYREILKRAGGEATLVVMGTHGRNPMERLFVGSTALQVLRGASCPVLTVRVSDGGRS